MDKVAKIDVAINIVVPFEVIEERLTGRRVCICGETYHVSTLKGKTTCDKCGKPLFVRDDDKIETVKARLQVYLNQTQPLIDYYAKKGILVDVEGRETVEKTFEEVRKVLE